MSRPEPNSPGLATPPVPTEERTRPVPPYIADLLAILHILLVYGRHLSLTLERRAKLRGFADIAECFGTARLPIMLARVNRGLLRIQALQRVLLDRARRGRDLTPLKPRQPRTGTKPPPAATRQATDPVPPKPPVRHRNTDPVPELGYFPTLKQLEAEIRRRPIGRALADICRDLGIAPRLCSGKLWNALYSMMGWYRGDFPGYYKDLHRRAVAFRPEWDRDFTLGVPEGTPKAVQRVLGFFIGERWPVMPTGLLPRETRTPWRAATATGPP